MNFQQQLTIKNDLSAQEWSENHTMWRGTVFLALEIFQGTSEKGKLLKE
jgi:hypothetical protein